MKRIFTLMLLFAMLSVSFVACSDDKDEAQTSSNQKKIIGVWELTNYGYGMSSNWKYVRFDSDGTGYYDSNPDGVLNPSQTLPELVWSFTENGNTLIVVGGDGYYTYSFEKFEFLQNGSWMGVDNGTTYIYAKYDGK